MELQDDGYDCYISVETIEGKIFNRVIVGNFINKDNAENMVENMVEEGYEAFIAIYDVEGLSIPEESKETKYYAVIAGSFKNIDNANDRVNELKDKGIDSYVSKSNINEETFNRVIAGSFIERDNAKSMVNKLESYGYEAFIDIYIQ